MNSALRSCLILGYVLHRSVCVPTRPCVHVLVYASACVCLHIHVGSALLPRSQDALEALFVDLGQVGLGLWEETVNHDS